jgi:hypothetical protein
MGLHNNGRWGNLLYVLPSLAFTLVVGIPANPLLLDINRQISGSAGTPTTGGEKIRL